MESLQPAINWEQPYMVVNHEESRRESISLADLATLCTNAFSQFNIFNTPQSAIEFFPILNQIVQEIHPHMFSAFLTAEGDQTEVLIENEWMKVSLIHWPKGKASKIHGHAKGGCAFKILRGSLEEIRYSGDLNPQLLSINHYHRNAMGYIDDLMGLHAVSNPFEFDAISIHAYATGR